MTGAAELNRRWEAVASRTIAADMAFDRDFLVLGAGTQLAKVSAPIDEARLSALLAAAHGRAITPSSLRHVRRAIETWLGDKPLALTHLALSGLTKLANPKECAWRLFLADALIQTGVQPLALMKALGLEATAHDGAVDKYNPDQPRVPAGNPDGGQWTVEDWAEATTSTARRPRRSFQVADVSDTRQHEIRSDAAPTIAPAPPAPGHPDATEAQNLDESCQAFIAANCQARILRVFPGQYLACTLREVMEAAKAGDRAAQSACKLLFRKEYRK